MASSSSFTIFRRVSGATILGLTGTGMYALYEDQPTLSPNPAHNPMLNPQWPEWIKNWARAVATCSAGGYSKLHLGYFDSLTTSGQEKLTRAICKRPSSTALITVSNHTSSVDDPSIISALLPWNILARPGLLRWSLCSQEYCYKAGHGIIGMCFNAGKTLPIHRGAGVDQWMLKAYFEKVRDGDWVHIFPEGRIFQTGKLDGRETPHVTGGKLKWGVGKLVARAAKSSSSFPIVLPIYHTGMERIFPQNERTHKLKSIIPKTGKSLQAIVGDPVELDDILEAYVAKDFNHHDWESSEEERQYFAAITLRIEQALVKLESKAMENIQKQTHEEEVAAAERHKAREKQ